MKDAFIVSYTIVLIKVFFQKASVAFSMTFSMLLLESLSSHDRENEYCP